MFCTAIRINTHEVCNYAYKVLSTHKTSELALDQLKMGQIGLKIGNDIKPDDTIDSSGNRWSSDHN